MIRVRIVRQEGTEKRFNVNVAKMGFGRTDDNVVLQKSFHISELVDLRKALDQAIRQHIETKPIWVDV